jgi:hypothetical protein
MSSPDNPFSLETVAETLTGRLDHVTQQLDDLRAVLESRGKHRATCVQSYTADGRSRPHGGETLANLTRGIIAYHESSNSTASCNGAVTRLLAYSAPSNNS